MQRGTQTRKGRDEKSGPKERFGKRITAKKRRRNMGGWRQKTGEQGDSRILKDSEKKTAIVDHV